MTKKGVFLAMFLVAIVPSLLFAQSGRTAAELTAEATRAVNNITVREAQRMVDGRTAIIIDVREKDEYMSACLPKAVNIPRGVLEFSIAAAAPRKNSPILVYCKKGGRGALAAQTLQIMGYTNVANLSGGIDAWVAAEMPVQKP